ncbi:AMP-binding protein [Micromonospora sp. BRA006-A]|nr:AMP-binding protein [Micromonospora sp. BRA006-A]
MAGRALRVPAGRPARPGGARSPGPVLLAGLGCWGPGYTGQARGGRRPVGVVRAAESFGEPGLATALAGPVARSAARRGRRGGWRRWPRRAADVGRTWAAWLTGGRGGSALRVDYAADGFSADWVRGLVDQTVSLLSAGVREPGVPLGALPLLGATERERLLAWGRGPARPVPGVPLHELVLEWARRTPDAVAGVAAGEVLTYAELARRSGELAARLRSMGVRPGDVVSLALDRSMWTLVATLAVLRAGRRTRRWTCPGRRSGCGCCWPTTAPGSSSPSARSPRVSPALTAYGSSPSMPTGPP